MRTQALATWLDRQSEPAWTLLRWTRDRALQLAALLHLSTIAVAVLVPASPPLPILLTVTGLALVVLSLSRIENAARKPGADAHKNHVRDTDRDHALPQVDTRALDLERQAQRLVEIADRASQARREAELREQLWAEISARISHELRTPLNAVIGFSDMMSAEVFGPLGDRRYQDYISHIRQGGQDLLKSAEDTLALTSSLVNPPDRHMTVDLTAAIRDAWTFFGRAPDTRGIKLRMAASDDIEIVGEFRAVRQILINILTEALNLVPDKGTIEIATDDDGSVVMLAVRISQSRAGARTTEHPLAICIARVLLEQQGSGLIESTTPAGEWSAITFLDRAAQADFFATTPV